MACRWPPRYGTPVRRPSPGWGLTGAAPDQRDAALAAGCTAVLGKPYEAAQLCALVSAALSN